MLYTHAKAFHAGPTAARPISLPHVLLALIVCAGIHTGIVALSNIIDHGLFFSVHCRCKLPYLFMVHSIIAGNLEKYAHIPESLHQPGVVITGDAQVLR